MKKLTNFFNCAANGLQKTGGGTSQTRGHQLGVASVITSTLSRFDCVSLASRLRVLDNIRGISALFSPRVYRYTAVLLMVFVVGIGNAWAADRYIFGKTAVSSTGTLTTSSGKNIMVRTSNAGTSYSNVNEFFTYDENVPSSGSYVYMKGNEATTSSSSAQLQALKWKKNKTTTISWTNTKLKINNIKIYPYEGSSKNIKLTISNGTTSKEFTIQKKAGSSQTLLSVIEISDVVYTSSSGISISVDNTEDLNALFFFEAEEYVEITNGDTQAFKGESIPMKANVAGGEWSVTGGATINSSTGVLSVNADATGTIVVTYTKGTKSDTRNIAVQSGTTKSVTWNFATLTGGAVYACGVQSTIATSDVSYEGGFVNMVNNYVGVDLFSTGYKITAASFNVKTPSGGSKKIDYDYLTTGSKSAAGTYTTTSANYEDGEVASIDNKTAFRLWKNSTTTQVKSITLTLKREGASCTTPTIAWATGSTADITAINELAATDLGITVGEYTGDITWTLTGNDIVSLSNEDNDGCTITGKADAYGTATLTASFTVAEGGELCAGTYSVTKTIKIIECNEPAAETNEIARFFVPCDLANATGDGTPWTVTDEPSSSGMNTISTVKFGGTLSSSNWRRNPTSGLLYGKLTNTDDSYIKLKLNTGDFAAGDFVTAYVDENKNLLAMNSGEAKAFGEASASGITGEYKCSITLAADNIEDDGSIIIRRTNGIYVNRIIVTREPVVPSCAATVPGDITKGTLTSGSITLTAGGTKADGDTWYWQSSATGEDKTGTSGAKKTVNASGTYYIRSYNTAGNCWSDAKSITLTAEDFLATPEVTFNDGAYVVGASALDLSTLFTSQNTSAVSFVLKVASEDATVSGSNFTATKEGSYVIVATQVADANYTAVSEEATIVVTYPATGEATISYVLDVTDNGTTLQTTKVDKNVSTISASASTTLLAGGLGTGGSHNGDKGTHKGGRTLGINVLPSEDADKYFYVTLSVADGYEFTPSAISLKVLTIGGDDEHPVSYKAVLTDGVNSITGTATADSDAELTLGSWVGLGTTTLSGDVTLKLYAWYTTSDTYNAYRLSTPITITGTVAEYVPVSCSAYEFHYGTNGQDNWETACFTQVGETKEWRIADFAIPATTHYYVGYHGDGVKGWNSDWSAEKQWTDTYSDGNGAMVLLPGTSAVGQATGAQGSLIIWSDSKDKNKYVGFKPNGYGITYGGNSHAFATTETANVWETDVVTLPDVSTTYTMGLATATEGTYVTCAHSAAAEAISGMGVTILDGGKKKLYLNAGVWRTEEGTGEKIAIFDFTDDRNYWGANDNSFMTYNSTLGLYEGYVLSDATDIIFVRINKNRETPAWGEDISWNQTADITLGSLANTYAITGWTDGTDGKSGHSVTPIHPATGQKGKFRIWDNSSAQNWYVNFVPYYTLSYNGNGGSGEMSATARSSESSTLTVTVAANGFTAPAGKHFAGWAISQENADEGTVDYAAGDNYTLTADGTLYAVWETTYAQSIDLATYAQSHSGTAWQGYLTDNGYSYVIGSESGAEISLDNNNDFDTGLKLKKSTTSNISFSVAAGKMIKIVTGKVNGLSIAINGGSATAIPSGTDATHLATSYYYNAAVQNVVITETNTDYNIIREIKIENPYTVTYNANGGDDVAAATFYGSALTLPSASKGTDSFLGWFTEASGGTKIGDAGASYTPSASIELFAHWEAVSSDARLASITFSSNAGTLEPAFDPEVVNYTYTMSYGTAAVPTITGATAVNAGGSYTIVSQAEAWNETAVIRGVAASSDTKQYNITMKIAPKDGVSLIKVATTGGTNKTVTGAYAGDGDVNLSSGDKARKMDKGKYIGFTLDGTTLQAGDRINVHTTQAANNSGSHIIFYDNMTDKNKLYDTEAIGGTGNNIFTINAAMVGATTAYVYRSSDDAPNNWNGFVDYIEVTRAMNPVLTAIQFNSTDVTVTSTSVSATLPNGTNLGSMTVTPTIVWNGAGSAGVTSNAGAWIWGANTYVVTDKDGDATTYTITLNQAATIDRVEISGTLTVMEDLTTALTASVIDTNEEPASVQDVTWSVKSGDEAYAEVNSTTGVVTGKAIGTAHIIATSVANPTVSAQVEVVVTAFSGCKKAYWFGYADDAATNNVANNSTVFDGAPSSASNNSSKTIKLIEDEWEVSVSKKTGSIGAFGTFTVPAGYNATLYLVTNTGGSRTFQLKQSDVVKYTQNASSGDPVITKFEDVAAGTYTVLSTSNCSGFYMMAAELCRVPMTGVALDITSKSMLTIDPAFQLSPNFTPANATDKRISWTTTDGDVATVVDGLVTPVGAGTATITVTTTDGGYTATCEVTVSEINCTSFEGTIYEMTAKEQATRYDIPVSAGESNEVALTADHVVYTRGAAAAFGVKGSSAKTPRITAKSGETLSAVDYNSGDVYVKIPLGCNLRPTDVITFTANDDTKEFKLGNTAASEGTISTSSLSYTVQSGDALEGRNVLYVWRGSNTGFVSVNVTRVPIVSIESVALSDLTIRTGKTNTPQMTVTPANGTILSVVWEIVSATGVTGSTIDAATGAVTAGTLDDPEQSGTITVKVTLNEDVDLSATCTVTVVDNIAQTNVDGSIVWDWHNTGATSSNQLSNKTDPKKNENFVLANVVTANANFATDKLVVEGEHLTRDYDKATPYFQGQLVSFRFAAATEGVVRITYSHTAGEMTEEKPAREIYINDVATGEIADNATFKASALIPVNASEVTITARNINSTASDDKQYLRIAKIEFYALDKVRDDSWIAPRELGTVCYPNGHIVVGADMYQMAGVNANGKFAFDQVEVTEPGVPYLFEATGYGPIKFYKTTAATVDEPGTSNGMVGTFVQMTLSPATDVNAYYFQGTHFYAVADRTKDLTVPANRCYVDLTEPHAAAAPRAGVRRITFGVNGTNGATGFENIEASEKPMKLLIDGKIYILRGEKMFDATGRLVK